jgi:hypothetical protein
MMPNQWPAVARAGKLAHQDRQHRHDQADAQHVDEDAE